MKVERPGGPKRLFWQVYLHGALLLVLIAIALGATGLLLGRAPARLAYREWLAGYLEARVSEIESGDPGRLGRDLAHERELVGVDVTLYRPDATVVTSNVDPPLEPLPPAEVARLAPGTHPLPHQHFGIVVPIVRDGRVVAYALAQPKPLLPHLVHAGLALSIVLLVLAIASIPLARAISSPVEKMTAAAERLGGGDLSARTGLRRRGELGRLAGAFDDMAGRLEQLVRGEKELLANVSHELRTPIARIRVALELASEGDEERARRALAEIASDLQELDGLVEDVLTAARLDLAAGRAGDAGTPLRRVPVEGRALIEESAERFRARHPDRTLAVEIDDDLPPLSADPSLLRRAIDNLLDNARKYSDEGQPIALAARAVPGGLQVSVTDRGIGIEPEDLARLFTPFFRTDRSRTRGTGGIGLGLALARRIVEAHGGTIEAESRPDEGTTIRFFVPGTSA